MQTNHSSWLSDPLEHLDAEAVEKEVQGAYKVLYKMTKASCPFAQSWQTPHSQVLLACMLCALCMKYE